MPIIPAGPGVENEPEANPVFPKIQQSDVASPGFLDVAAASERSSNLVGQLYDRYIDHPKPDAAAEPGFNPVDHVPSGYLHDYGSRFLDATNPAQVQWIKNRIDSERADGGVIARAKGWGIASSLAAGITDPLTLSSMALIPEAAPTRLGNALRWATMNAATTAGQEAISSSLSETRDIGDAALNVGASSVLGGVLGSIARRVPAATMAKTAADLHPELRPSGGEDVLGPNQRSILADTKPALPVNPIDVNATNAEKIEQIHALTKENLPNLQKLIDDINGTVQGAHAPDLDAGNVKTDKSILEKASRPSILAKNADFGIEHLADTLRFKTEITSIHQLPQLMDTFKRNGLEVIKSDPAKFEEPSAWGWRSFPVDIRMPNGQMVEHYAVGAEMNKAQKAEGHAIYEKWRNEDLSQLSPEQRAEYFTDRQRSRDLYAGAWERDFGRAGDGLTDARASFDKAVATAKSLTKTRSPSGPSILDANLSDQPEERLAAQKPSEPKTSGSEPSRSEVTSSSIQPPTAESVPQGTLPGEPLHVNPNMESTSGAAQVAGQTLEDLTTGKGGQTLAKTIGKVAPAARTMTQPSLAARKLTAELVNIPGTLEQNYRGIANPNPIERILWGYDGVHMQGIAARKSAFNEYLTRIKEAGESPMSRREFMDNVSYAMRRGDKSEIPEVAKAAAATRKVVFQPLYDRAIKLGLVDDQAKLYADSYLTRQYDAVKIRQNLDGWMKMLRQGFQSQGTDPAFAADAAHKVTRNVLGSERGTMDWNAMGGVATPTKDRALTLPDTTLEPFLTTDIDHLSHSYLRSMAPQVEMTERFGSRDMKDQFQDITDEYARMIQQAEAKGDPDEMNRLSRLSDSTISDLAAMRDRLYGIYGAPKDPGNFFVRAGRLARSFNALRLLGPATLSHFPDLGNVMMRYGMPNTFAGIARMMPSMQAIKLSLSEAQRMGAAVDMTMNMSASLLGDYGSHSQFAEQRFAAGAAKFFTIATGETPLITMTQALTSTLAQDELLRAADKIAGGGTIEGHEMARLASAGIDEEMLGRIAKESGNTKTINGLRFGMSDQWEDQGAAKAFESAVIREAHGVTLRPGAGDTPLLMSSELGKLVLQFKSFAFAANRVVGMPLAQGVAHGDVRSAAALMGLASMGALSYIAKQKAANQPLETDPTRLALEVMDKSNLMGWTSELIYPALWQAGFKNLSRWSDRDPVETLGGPTAGTVASTFERQLPGRIAPQGFTNQDLPFRRSDLHFLRRMAPAQNLWYARKAINTLEDSVGDLFDLPGESNESRETARNEESPTL